MREENFLCSLMKWKKKMNSRPPCLCFEISCEMQTQKQADYEL